MHVHFVSFSVNQDGSQEPSSLDMELIKYFSALDTQLCFPKKKGIIFLHYDSSHISW